MNERPQQVTENSVEKKILPKESRGLLYEWVSKYRK